MEEFEDEIVSMFAKSEKQLHEKLCVAVAEVCPKDAVPDADDSSSESSDDFDFDREELWIITTIDETNDETWNIKNRTKRAHNVLLLSLFNVFFDRII